MSPAHREKTRLALVVLATMSMTVDCSAPGPDEGRVDSIKAGLTYSSIGFPYSEYPLFIQSVNSGKYLDLLQGTVNGSGVRQYHYTGQDDQIFFLSRASTNKFFIRSGEVGGKNLQPTDTSIHSPLEIMDSVNSMQLFGLVAMSDGSYEIVSDQTGMCLDVWNAATDDGEIIQQFPCTGNANQRWQLLPAGRPMHLIAKHSAKCLDVAGASQADNTTIQQYPCLPQANQDWIPLSMGTVSGVSYYEIVSSNGGKCLHASSGTSNAPVVQMSCNGSSNQQWRVTENGDGYTTLKSRLSSSLCLDVASGTSDDHMPLQLYPCTGNGNQRFFWSVFIQTHLHVVQVGTSSGRLLSQSNQGITDHVNTANSVYGPYGIHLIYDPTVDNSTVYNDCLAQTQSPDGACTCPDGSTNSPDGCVSQYATNWPNQVVAVTSGDNSGMSTGNANYIEIGYMEPATVTTYCSMQRTDTQWLSHEFGHYMGLNHAGPWDTDLLSDTPPDPGCSDCLSPLTPTACSDCTTSTPCDPGAFTILTNNPMGHFRNVAVQITPMQASLVRATAWTRRNQLH